jgi:GntR family transcriptional regulator
VRTAEPPYQRVAAALRARITAGEWLPGEQIPPVRQIADEYDVSVTTARRALMTLRDEGLITITPGWGSFRAES